MLAAISQDMYSEVSNWRTVLNKRTDPSDFDEILYVY